MKLNMRAAGFPLPSNPPPPVAPPFLSPLLAFPFLSVEPPLFPSAGFPVVLAAASGGPRGEGTPGEPTPSLPLRDAAQTGLWREKINTDD